MVTIDRERLISEKQNNKASAEGARLPKEAMLLRDIFKFTKASLDAFRPFGLISRACQGPTYTYIENKMLMKKYKKWFKLPHSTIPVSMSRNK